jgi:hypothetical protein
VISFDNVREQTLTLRRTLVKKMQTLADKADVIPPGWNNNLRWHAGHLVVTPRNLTHGIAGEPLGVPAEYRIWFGKGSSPREWGNAPIPSYAQLLDEMVSQAEAHFAVLAKRDLTVPFANAYPTTPGIVLETPAQALVFSFMHDGIHLGMVLALARALG